MTAYKERSETAKNQKQAAPRRERLVSREDLKKVKANTLAQIGHRFDANAKSGARLSLMVCGGGGCHSSGSGKLIARLAELAARDAMQDEIAIERTGCFGLCSEGPILVVQPEGVMYTKVSEDDMEEIWESHVKGGKIVERLLSPHEKDFFSKQNRIALKNCGRINPERIEEYIALDGYAALAKALYEMQPEDVIEVVKDSGLRGRGGGGFPVGTKWEVAAQQQTNEKIVVCNADEGDPGAFMDRSILEDDPHSVLEAMAITAYAIGAQSGYIYVRAEYPTAVERLKIAIAQAHEYGLLGKNILGKGLNFDIEIRLGAGAFVCGEATALMISIEGNRGEPRLKPLHQRCAVSLASRRCLITLKPLLMCHRFCSKARIGSAALVPKNPRARRFSRSAARSTTPVWWRFRWVRRSGKWSTTSVAGFRAARHLRPRRPAARRAAAFLQSIWTHRSITKR